MESFSSIGLPKLTMIASRLPGFTLHNGIDDIREEMNNYFRDRDFNPETLTVHKAKLANHLVLKDGDGDVVAAVDCQQKSECDLIFHSWNIKGTSTEAGMAKIRKKTVTAYFQDQDEKVGRADIVFLQEVEWVKKFLLDKHINLPDPTKYDTIGPESKEAYVIYNKSKLDVVWDLNEWLDKSNPFAFPILDVELIKRISLCILKVIDIEESEIIVASFHNAKIIKEVERCTLIVQLCRYLAILSDITGYPVLLAGDFNMDVEKIESISKENKFQIHNYKRTDRRKHKEKIDFFLSLQGFHASIILPGKVIANLPTEDDKINDHDPLRATFKINTHKCYKVEALKARIHAITEFYVCQKRINIENKNLIQMIRDLIYECRKSRSTQLSRKIENLFKEYERVLADYNGD